MKYLHVIPSNHYEIIPFSRLMQSHPRGDEHEFLTVVIFSSLLKHSPKLLTIRNLNFIPNFKRLKAIRKQLYIIKKAKSADRIVWHSLAGNNGYTPWILFFNPKLLKKSVWIVGNQEFMNIPSIQNRVLNPFNKYIFNTVRSKIPYVGVLFPTEREFLLSQGVDASKIYELPYPLSSRYKQLVHKAYTNPKLETPNNTPWIQVGMNAKLRSGHLKVFKIIKTIEEVDKSVLVVPLSYTLKGESKYLTKTPYVSVVQKYAEKMRVKKIYLKAVTSEEGFLTLVKHIDMLLIGDDYFVSIPQILCYIAQEKPIFMSEESPLYRCFEDFEIGINALESIKSISPEAMSEYTLSHCSPKLIHYFSDEGISEKWTSFFKQMT